jgi:hypothetical protein
MEKKERKKKKREKRRFRRRKIGQSGEGRIHYARRDGRVPSIN